MGDTMTDLLRRLLEDLTAIEPLYETNTGDTACIYCHADDPSLRHDDDCAWSVAKQLMERLAR